MFKVGDKVQFTINGVTYVDTIVCIDAYSVEGNSYDLTYARIKGLLKHYNDSKAN